MIQLRAARPMDAGKVGAILSEFAGETDWLPQVHSAAQDIAHAGTMIERGWVLVAEVDNAIVGFAASNGETLIALYVARRARGQSIGSQVLNKLKQEQPVLRLWTFQANAAAQRFYLRHGFVEVARGDGSSTDEKLPDVHYELRREAR